MKKIFYVLVFAIALSLTTSCGADQKKVNACAEELCTIMDELNIEEDPMGALSVIEKMTAIMENEDYKNITEKQLYSAMEKQCPEGYKKFKELAEGK